VEIGRRGKDYPGKNYQLGGLKGHTADKEEGKEGERNLFFLSNYFFSNCQVDFFGRI